MKLCTVFPPKILTQYLVFSHCLQLKDFCNSWKDRYCFFFCFVFFFASNEDERDVIVMNFKSFDIFV